MAGFTSMALLGAGLLGGAVGGSVLAKRRQQQQQQQNQQLAPGPTDLNTAATPQPPIVNPADANAQGLAAGRRQRKRAAQGSLLTNPVAPTSNTLNPGPRYAQRTLLGS